MVYHTQAKHQSSEISEGQSFDTSLTDISLETKQRNQKQKEQEQEQEQEEKHVEEN